MTIAGSISPKLAAFQKTSNFTLLRIGNLYLDTKNFEEARKTFRELLTQEPFNEQAYLGIAFSYEIQKDTLGAIRAFEEALKANESFDEVRENLVAL